MSFPTDAVITIVAVAVGFALNEWSTRRSETRAVRRIRATDERVALERLQEALAVLAIDLGQSRFEQRLTVAEQNERQAKREALTQSIAEHINTVHIQLTRIRHRPVRDAAKAFLEVMLKAIADGNAYEVGTINKAFTTATEAIGEVLRNDVPSERSLVPRRLARLFDRSA